MKKPKEVYNSLDELRRDKHKVNKALSRETEALKRDAVDMVLPSNNVFFTSDYSFMRYIGYAITAYKSYTTFRTITSFFSRKRK